MKISAARLRRLIQDTIEENYGWPVAEEKPLYGVGNRMKVTDPKDPVNPNIKEPKGPNSRTNMGESRRLNEEIDPVYDSIGEWSKRLQGALDEIDDGLNVKDLPVSVEVYAALDGISSVIASMRKYAAMKPKS